MRLRRLNVEVGVIASCLFVFNALIPSSAKAMILFQDNFDNEAQRLATTSLDNWHVTSGDVDVIGTNFFDLYPGNGNYLDMDGDVSGAIETKQVFNLTPGTYQLSFDIGQNFFPDSGLSVQVGSVFSESFAATSTLTSILRSFSVTNTINARLSFVETGSSNFGGSVLDNVVLRQTQAQAVPTPAPLIGLIGMGVAVIRKRKQEAKRSPQ